MPLAVQAASPSTVLPYSLARAFSRTQEWAAYQNQYLAGEIQNSALTATSRKRWARTDPLSAAELQALEDFFLGQQGAAYEFYFYDVNETTPRFSYDETGSDTDGRYAVRFEGPLTHALGLPRNEGQYNLVEVS